MLLGSVFSMCWTVACRLYSKGATTKMEYMGGGVVVLGGEMTGCSRVEGLMVEEESVDPGESFAPGDSGDGMLSFMDVVEGTEGSGT